MECKSSGLCLFDDQDVQTDILGNSIVDYHPVTIISHGAPIEFFVPGTTDEYIDMSDINLLVHVKLTKKDGKPVVAADDKVALVNQPLSSLFQDVFLTIGDTQVEGGQHCYPYNAYISSLIQFHPSAKKTHMQAWGWNEDEPGKFEAEANEGYKFRVKETEGTKEWELYGPLFLDMTRQSRYLLPKTDLRFKLIPSKDDFVLHCLDATKTDVIAEITKCILYVRRIRVNDTVISGHNVGLKKDNAKYLLNHIDIKTFTITAGVTSVIKDRLYMSQAPKMLIVGLLEHDAFNGVKTKNPFNFQHFNLNKVGLYRDGELVPGQIYTPDYTKGHFVRSYVHAMRALNYFNTDDSNGLTLEHFEKGYNLYMFDLTPDANVEASYRSPLSFSNLRLELGFAKPVVKPLTAVLYASFDAKAAMTELRDVVLNYNR